MRKLFICLVLLGLSKTAFSETIDDYLERNNLLRAYQQKIQEIKDEKIWIDRLGDLDKSIDLTIKSPLNEKYKLSYLSDLLKEFPYNNFHDKTDFEAKYAVRYDPLGSIKYLETIEKRSFGQNFQLMVLLQIFQPEKVATDVYKRIAEKSHKELQAYFEAEEWQSDWREKEYNEQVGNNFQACYADLKCLLNIIPYWRGGNEDVEVYIPCETAQKHNKVVYFDGAGGGHGAQSRMISDCELYEKYNFDAELADYMNMLFKESIPETDGSIRFVYQAQAVYDSFVKQYSPHFDLDIQKRWDVFPYSEWAVRSYYNFKKFNEVLHYGIGYKKALERLTEYYVKSFGVDREKAFNTALYALMIPSIDSWGLITSNDLHYMLLTGVKWEDIENVHKDMKNYKELLEFSIAFSENLQKIIALGKAEVDFDIDYANWFGKTPLMLAAQYGYIESVKLLLENGADINRQTIEDECWSNDESLCITHGKRSALMYAMQEGQYEVAKYLLNHGADISLQDTKGKTAYDYMLGQALGDYNPHKKMTINGGSAQRYFDDEEKKSAFTSEQIKELTFMLQIKD